MTDLAPQVHKYKATVAQAVRWLLDTPRHGSGQVHTQGAILGRPSGRDDAPLTWERMLT